MKLKGNIFTTVRDNQGLKTAANGTIYAHLTLSVGTRVMARDAKGAVILGADGQPQQVWSNQYYSLTLFGAMAQKVCGDLEAAKAQGRKVIELEVSGEHTTSIYTKKDGTSAVDNKIRVISMRTPGAALWTTTAGGQLVERQLN